MTFEPSMTKAQVLYKNILRNSDAVVAYDGAEVSGYEAINGYDWRDFSLFQTASGTTHLTATLGTGETIDTLCMWPSPTGIGDVAVTLDYSTDGGSVWTTLTTMSFSATDYAMKWADFASTDIPDDAIVRLTFVSSQEINWRQMTIGQKLTFPIGQWRGIAPPKLLGGIVQDNVISINGSILGRNIRRILKEGELNLNLLTQTWVRDTWEDFSSHASKYAFWWRWSPVKYPTEIAFTVASKINQPTNDNPPGRMAVTMPLLYLS